MKKTLLAASLCALVSLSGGAANASDLQGLKQLQVLDKSTTEVSPLDGLLKGQGDDDDMRLRAMRDAAMSVGAQHGYATFLKQLKNDIEEAATSLDSLFAFNDLMRTAGTGETELYLLPAVLKEAENVTSISSDHKAITVSGKSYTIEKAERLVTRAPNWRQYLLYDKEVDLAAPHHSLLPESNEEKQAWAKWVSEGWFAGIEQADREMTHRIRRLGGDFNGMVRYLRLILEGKITKPEVVATSRDVVGGGKQMSIQNEVYHLTSEGQLVPQKGYWKPIILDNRGSMLYPDEMTSYEYGIRQPELGK